MHSGDLPPGRESDQRRRWVERFARLRRTHPGTLLRRGLAAMLFLLAAALAAFPTTANGAPTSPMLVAARELPLGTTLRAADVEVVRVPDHLRPAGVLTEPGDVAGQVLVGIARPGEPLTDARIAGPKTNPSGTTTVPVRLADAGIARLLRPGIRVDVITVGPSDSGEKVLASGVRVLTVVNSPNPVRASTGGERDGPLVLLTVPEADAPKLAAAALGQPVTITLR